MKDADSFIRYNIRKILTEANRDLAGRDQRAKLRRWSQGPISIEKNKSALGNSTTWGTLPLHEKDKDKKDRKDSTRGVGRGGIKKDLRGLKALADENPAKLMSNLKINFPAGDTPEDMINDLMSQAVGGAKAMQSAYGDPREKKDKFGRVGFIVPVQGDLTPRDGLIFIRETVKGAINSGFLNFDEQVRAELLGNDILVYQSHKPFGWNQPGKKKKGKEPSGKTEKPEKENKPDSPKDKKDGK